MAAGSYVSRWAGIQETPSPAVMTAPLLITIVVLVYFTVLVFRTDRELSWKDKRKKKPEEMNPGQ